MQMKNNQVSEFQLTKDEISFLKILYDKSATLKLPTKKAYELINKFIYQANTVTRNDLEQTPNVNTNFSTMKVETSFSLATTLLDVLKHIHMTMLFLEQATHRDIFIKDRCEQLVETLEHIFSKIYDAKFQERVKNDLTYSLQKTLELSYENTSVCTHFKDVILISAYRENYSLQSLKLHCNVFLKHAKNQLNRLKERGVDESSVSSSIQHAEAFFNEIKADYEATTKARLPKGNFITLNALSLLVYFALVTEPLALTNFLAFLVIAPIFYFANVRAQNSFLSRKLNAATLDKYVRLAQINNDLSKDDFNDKRREQICTLLKEGRHEEVADLSLCCKRISLFSSTLSALDETKHSLFAIKKTCIPVYTFNYQPQCNPLPAPSNLHKLGKPTKGKRIEPAKAAPIIIPAPSTEMIHTELSKIYNNGFLCSKDKSKAFLSFGKFKEKILNQLPELKDIPETEISTIPKKGKFKGFKIYSSGQGALKFFDGLRVLYSKSSETVKIDNAKIPVWEPYNTMKK